MPARRAWPQEKRLNWTPAGQALRSLFGALLSYPCIIKLAALHASIPATSPQEYLGREQRQAKLAELAAAPDVPHAAAELSNRADSSQNDSLSVVLHLLLYVQGNLMAGPRPQA